MRLHHLEITAFGPFGRSSSAVKLRPKAGLTSSVGK